MRDAPVAGRAGTVSVGKALGAGGAIRRELEGTPRPLASNLDRSTADP